jgi:rubrerythrin
MFNSVTIDVVISLVFVYVLYSLLITTINEIIASALDLRARTLAQGIQRMLSDKTDKKTSEDELVKSFYEQPGIRFLGQDNNKRPAYISAALFSKGLIDLLKDRAANKSLSTLAQISIGIETIRNSDPQTAKFIESLLEDTHNDLDEFRRLLESWFNETMERATGWYKKRAQRITLVLGFMIALSFNVDSIAITRYLSHHPEAAIEMADMAQKYAEAHKDSLGQLTASEKDSLNFYLKKAKEQLDVEIADANKVLGLGWNKKQLQKDISQFNGNELGYWALKLIGLLLTTLALALGAPFWFDMLNKVIQLRSSKKPTEPTTGVVTTDISIKRVG